MGKHGESLEDKMERNVDYGEGDDCWIWTAGVQSGGYAEIWFGGKHDAAYRLIYELVVGPIPENHDLDHECHNRAVERGECAGGKKCPHRRCVRPSHMAPKPRGGNLGSSPLTQASINKAKTECKRGHEFTAENTRLRKGTGWRSCKACDKMTPEERREWDRTHDI